MNRPAASGSDGPGPLLAAGRDADIFEYGPGRVLRRSRNGHPVTLEARTMEYLRSKGYPVPAVHQVSDDGTELVMARVDGPSMVGEMTRRPWTIRRHARTLAALHLQLHDITAPAWLRDSPVAGPVGDRLVHLDLHPLNIILSEAGPVVIDWTNAARGAPEADVAVTWALLACAGIPTGRARAALLGSLRRIVVETFLAGFDRSALVAFLGPAVEWKTRDAHMTSAEVAAMRRLAAQASRGRL